MAGGGGLAQCFNHRVNGYWTMMIIGKGVKRYSRMIVINIGIKKGI